MEIDIIRNVQGSLEFKILDLPAILGHNRTIIADIIKVDGPVFDFRVIDGDWTSPFQNPHSDHMWFIRCSEPLPSPIFSVHWN